MSDPSQEDLDLAFQKPERPLVQWIIGGVLVLVLIGIGFLYSRIEQRGLTIRGRSHLFVQPSGAAWAFFVDGSQVKVSPESAKKHQLASGPCDEIVGSLREKEPLFDIDTLSCSPGQSVAPRVIERIAALGLDFGYWKIESEKQSLADTALTTELVAAIIDPRADDPQITPLYGVMFPEWLAEARAEGSPPPLIIHVDRNDAVKDRFDRERLEAFLKRPQFMLAGGGAKGGWVIRTLTLVPTGTLTIDSLLVDPNVEPWPTELRKPTLFLARKQTLTR